MKSIKVHDTGTNECEVTILSFLVTLAISQRIMPNFIFSSLAQIMDALPIFEPSAISREYLLNRISIDLTVMCYPQDLLKAVLMDRYESYW